MPFIYISGAHVSYKCDGAGSGGWGGGGACHTTKELKMQFWYLLGLIYMVQLCHIRYDCVESRTHVLSCKSILQLACDCCVRCEECRGLLKQVLKPYDSHSHRQFCIVDVVYDFSMTKAAHVYKNRMQQS